MTLARLDAWLSAAQDGDDAYYSDGVRARLVARQQEDNDARQLDRLRDGDVTVFEMLYFQHATPLRRFVSAMIHSTAVAEEIVQDVFAQLWERRVTVEVKTSIRAYLYAAARGRALTALRANGVREAYAARPVTDDVVIVPSQAPDALAGLEREELTGALSAALASLSPRVRQAAELRWFGKLTHAEVASVMRTSPATVNNQLTTALRALREQLAPYFE